MADQKHGAVMDEDRRKKDPSDPAEQGKRGDRDQPRDVQNRKLRTEDSAADRGTSPR